MTFTRTHVYIEFANPYLVRDLCRQPVTAWHNNDKCGCEAPCWNMPCEHALGTIDTCPSWSPVDGCTCQEVLGSVDHAPAPQPQRPS